MMNRRDALKKSALLSAYAFSAGTMTALLSGCNADVKEAGWTPSFVSADQNEILVKLIDTILPKSDTPGASDVGVHKFIDKMMTEFCNEEEKTNFKSGLDKVLADKPEDMKGYMSLMAKEAKISDKLKSQEVDNYKSKEFFTQLRSLTMFGYYTSEEICTTVLEYDPIPGGFIGCYPLEKTNGRAWAL